MKKYNTSIFNFIQKQKNIAAIALLGLLAGYSNIHAQAVKEITVAGKSFKDFNGNGKLDQWEDTRLSEEKRIDAIIKAMSNEDKANFLIGTGMPGAEAIVGPIGAVQQGRVPGAAGGTFPMPKFGLPAVIVADGPAGLRINPTRENDSTTYYATAFPVGTSLASTWNKDLLFQVGKAMGNEVKEYGVDVLLAPALNIQRNPLNGRNFEYYSEDPLVSGKAAAAIVNGIQSNGVGTSIKHFAANNSESNRLSVNAHISERAMREIYLKGFEITVKESDPWTVMTSYNKVNGTYTSESKDLLTTILRNEWGYKGIVMTDWFGGFSGFDAIRNGNSDVVAQVNAGNDLLMPGIAKQKDAILVALNNGKIPQELANRNIKHILQLVFRSPSFDHYQYSNQPNAVENAKITRNAATEGMVLLKNENNALPYSDTNKSVALFGVTSYAWITGGTGSGSVNNKHTVSLLEGLTSAGYKLDQELVNLYQLFAKKEQDAEMARRKKAGLLALPETLPEIDLSQDLYNKKAESANVAFITIGRNSGEGGDRKNIAGDFQLTEKESQMLDGISKAFHAKGKKVIAILNIGGVIETASWKDKVDAILLTWQPGQEGGFSVADVLSGKVNPSGKLAQTFPVKYEDNYSSTEFPGTPINDPKEITYNDGIYVGYRYYDTFKIQPSYEFGFGKSYTTFKYSEVKTNSSTFNNSIEIQVKVTNTGKVAGKEVVQLYLSAPTKSIDKPVHELKGFAKTKDLKPGESEVLTVPLSASDLASFVPSKSAWIADAGNYKVEIGASSKDIKETINFSLPKEIVVEKVKPTFQADKKFVELKP